MRMTLVITIPGILACRGSGAITCRRSGILLFIALLGSLACGREDVAASAYSHPWLNRPAAVDAKSVELPAWLIYRVEAGRRPEAIDMLSSEPYVQISPGMAQYFTEQDVRVPAEMRPFLVRAVATPDAEITVTQSMTGLWTRSRQALGSRPTAMPLVVLIDPTPLEIYVSAE